MDSIRTTGKTDFVHSFTDALIIELHASSSKILKGGHSENEIVYLEYKRMAENQDYRKISSVVLYMYAIIMRSDELTIDKFCRLYYFLTKDGSTSTDKLAAFSMAYEICTITSTSNKLFEYFLVTTVIEQIGFTVLDVVGSYYRETVGYFNVSSWYKLTKDLYPAVCGLTGGIGLSHWLIDTPITCLLSLAIKCTNLNVYTMVIRKVAKQINYIQFWLRMYSWLNMYRADHRQQTININPLKNAGYRAANLLPYKPRMPISMVAYVVTDLNVSIGC